MRPTVGPVNSSLAVVYFSGFATTMALIAAIGAQNAFVLRQGIRREHVLAVVALCSVSDLVLITAGIAGFGALVTAHPDVVTIARFGGAVFLAGYGLLAARRAVRPGTLTPSEAAPARLAGVLGTCLALTFLNPHVYLDTVVMLGSVASSHGDARWTFAAGAMAASVAWFGSLGFAARALSGPLSKPSVWRAIDLIIGVVILVVAVKLVWH